MARIEFRQGIVRHQTDTLGNPTFLAPISGGSQVSLIVSPDPTIINIAHNTTDYLFQESVTVNAAWQGPFVSGTDYWLYWDIDLLTGERTFGHTIHQPVVSSAPPPNPPTDLHWFNLANTTMNVFNGASYVEKLRVFAAKYENGAVLVPYPIGSQVGINMPVDSGFLLFDDELKPIKKFDKFNRGKFITTETKIASQLAKLANFRLEAQFIVAKAIEPIPAFSPVTYKGPREIGLAKTTNPDFPAVGLASEDLFSGEVRGFITQGYITNDSWNWTEQAGTPIFYNSLGQLTTDVPQTFSIQQVAVVVDPKVIFVDIGPLIKYA